VLHYANAVGYCNREAMNGAKIINENKYCQVFIFYDQDSKNVHKYKKSIFCNSFAQPCVSKSRYKDLLRGTKREAGTSFQFFPGGAKF